MVPNGMTEFCKSLKSWRAARRYSQLDLALAADISARHLSFLETGRAQPSRDMVARLGDALQLPLDARNQLLTHAGFAVRYKGREWNDEAMSPIRRAVEHMLQQHMPFPGMAIDRLWTVREANPAALHLFALLGIEKGSSLLDLMISDVMPTVVENWPEVAHHAAMRLRTESLAQGGISALDRAVDHLAKVPAPNMHTSGPVIPTILRQGDVRLSLFVTIAQFGTPEDLLLDDLKIELYFPTDDETERVFQKMFH